MRPHFAFRLWVRRLGSGSFSSLRAGLSAAAPLSAAHVPERVLLHSLFVLFDSFFIVSQALAGMQGPSPLPRRSFFFTNHAASATIQSKAFRCDLHPAMRGVFFMSSAPSIDQWLKEAKADPSAAKIGMYLVHNGTVRQTAKKLVRQGDQDTRPVTGMVFSYDKEKVAAAVEETYRLEGIYYVRTWLNEGELTLGDDIMYVLIGGDIRPHVVDALQFLVGRIKTQCVIETELY